MKNLGGFALVLLLGCSSKRNAADAKVTIPAPPSATSATVRPHAVVAPLSTHGKVRCGERPCEAGKEACVSRAGHDKCEARSADHSYDSNDPIYECDDSSDCSPDAICCAMHMGGGYCQPRAHDRPPLMCNEELCFPDAGAPCAVGESCVKRDPADFAGTCMTRPIRATCGRGKRCSAAKGMCIWDPSRASGTCASPSEADAVTSRTSLNFECTKPGDCSPTMRCCTDAGDAKGAFCQPACELANSTFLCDSDVDCREGMQEPFTNAKCVPAARSASFKAMGYPPWVSVCHFE